MKHSLEDRLRRVPVVPLVQANAPDVAVDITRALVAGGLSVVEVVLRTPEALQCLAAIGQDVPDAIVGAGTVLNEAQALASLEAGAQFIVSPGLDDAVVALAQARAVPVFPGVSTATEAQRAWNLGLRRVKFFPAGSAGGVSMLKSLGSVFRDMKFMPTGGVSAANLTDYLALPSVLACGGSWLTPADAVTRGDYGVITELAREAAEIAVKAR